MMGATALWFTGPRRVESRPVEVPEPDPDEVVVEARVSAISAGTELLLYRDEMPTGLAADETIDSLGGDLSYPSKYGYATVGEVVETGDAVPDPWVGRRVFAFQPHQTQFLASVDGVIRVPRELDDDTAALLPFMETAVTLTLDANPRIGERTIVFGAGVIGLCTLHLLDEFPLGELVAVEPIEERRALARSFGADETHSTPPADGTFDIAVEVSGDPYALNPAVQCVGFDGKVIVGSWYGSKSTDLELGGRFHRDRVTVTSSQVSTIGPELRGRWDRERRLEVALEHLIELPTEALITDRVPFRDAEQAYRVLDRAPERSVQVLLTYD